jgi:hypothetical protein
MFTLRILGWIISNVSNREVSFLDTYVHKGYTKKILYTPTSIETLVEEESTKL